jgi:phosphoglycolate phosphatase-like HAD superfamily hydrolase
VRVSGTSFVATLTRAFAPVKPAPAPLLHLCEHALGLPPAHVLMVGDHLDDLQCGAAAGAATVLLRNADNGRYAPHADVVIDALPDLIPILEDGFTIRR